MGDFSAEAVDSEDVEEDFSAEAVDSDRLKEKRAAERHRKISHLTRQRISFCKKKERVAVSRDENSCVGTRFRQHRSSSRKAFARRKYLQPLSMEDSTADFPGNNMSDFDVFWQGIDEE